MLATQCLAIKRSILAFWVGYAAAELKRIYLRVCEIILASGKNAVDEAVAPGARSQARSDQGRLLPGDRTR